MPRTPSPAECVNCDYPMYRNKSKPERGKRQHSGFGLCSRCYYTNVVIADTPRVRQRRHDDFIEDALFLIESWGVHAAPTWTGYTAETVRRLALRMQCSTRTVERHLARHKRDTDVSLAGVKLNGHERPAA